MLCCNSVIDCIVISCRLLSSCGLTVVAFRTHLIWCDSQEVLGAWTWWTRPRWRLLESTLWLQSTFPPGSRSEEQSPALTETLSSTSRVSRSLTLLSFYLITDLCSQWRRGKEKNCEQLIFGCQEIVERSYFCRKTFVQTFKIWDLKALI